MTLTIADLERRIVAHARYAVSNGRVTTRKLATLAGWSQPYLQLVISGQRECNAAMADSLITALRITAADLFSVEELADILASAADIAQARYETGDDDAA